jgi:hypothetical protein
MATDDETPQTDGSSTPSIQPTDSTALSVSDHELDLAEKQLTRSHARYAEAKLANDELRSMYSQPLRPEKSCQVAAVHSPGRHAASEAQASEPSVRPVASAPATPPVQTSEPAHGDDTGEHIVPGIRAAPERSSTQRKNRLQSWFQSLRDKWHSINPRGRIL